MESNTSVLEKSDLPITDLTISEIIKITGISRAKAYNSRFCGEYTIGKQRRVRRDIFMKRRSEGLNILKKNEL